MAIEEFGRMKQRQGSESLWDLSAEIPLDGEFCLARTSGPTDRFKIGDGTTEWTALDWFGADDWSTADGDDLVRKSAIESGVTIILDADTRIPTQSENDALAGTYGSPSSSNKYVTDTDTRVPSQGENDALIGTFGTPSNINKYITDTDTRIPTADENNALQGTSGSPSNTNRYVTDQDTRIVRTPAPIILIQGSKEDNVTNEGYVDSTDVAEDGASENGIIFCSSLNSGAGGTVYNWSEVLPITCDSDAKRTVIELECAPTDIALPADEDLFIARFIIDWDNGNVIGCGLHSIGHGYPYLNGYRVTGTIAASTANQTFTMTRQNGSYALSDDPPRIKISNNSGLVINELPIMGTHNNFQFMIRDELF